MELFEIEELHLRGTISGNIEGYFVAFYTAEPKMVGQALHFWELWLAS